MIEFVTLFLGALLTGPRSVEIMTGDAVAVVEVWLDGELEERLDAPPWRLEVDFGPELSPHVLDAVALDASGQELDRTRQWINMRHEPAQSSVMIEGVHRGRGAIARVSWASLGKTDEPRSVEAYFDGQQIAAEDPRRIRLPAFDPNQTHHFRVRLDFTDSLDSEAEAIFGGVYGDEVNTEISAVPIRFKKGRKPKTAESVQGWFLVDGVPQKVHALEKGPARIIVVRDMATQSYLNGLAARRTTFTSDTRLKKHHRVEFVSACPEQIQRDEIRHLVFPRSLLYSWKNRRLLELLAKVVPADCTPDRQLLADAVAAAGLAAGQFGLRRVVLLIVSGESRDRSAFSPAEVIAYLEKIRVPLVVWSPGPSSGLETEWGRATDVHDLERLRTAFDLLEKDLERQLIVWLDGLQLPQSVELRPGVQHVTLVK